jgi:hypothetical protein
MIILVQGSELKSAFFTEGNEGNGGGMGFGFTSAGFVFFC